MKSGSPTRSKTPPKADTPSSPVAVAPSTPTPWEKWTELQLAYQRDMAQLYMNAWSGREEAKSVIEAPAGDRRFAASAWKEPYYDFLRQGYLLYERFVLDSVEAMDIEAREHARLRFHARQFVHALSPANFLATNPIAIQTALETQGESLARGLSNLLQDVQRGRISLTDKDAFAVGRNLATTPGSVVFENEVMQLVQYAPTTEKVRARPLLIVPPCINKYYILDLSPHNSFVRWAVEQGNTVFMISWRNIDASGAHLTWDDYIRDGVLKAIDLSCRIGKSERINALGFCVGGTMLGAALAVLARQAKWPVESMTLFATMLDFSDTGEIGWFVDEGLVQHFESTIGAGGVRSGRDLASTFSALRENDLIWPYVSSNYLLGKTPPAFDILYWNGDATNLPGPWYCWYLRHTYLENNLRKPDAVTVCGEPLDLSRIDVPVYMVGTREDHIVPWVTAYKSNEFLRGPRRFVLGASGHIAGIVNPPASNKRSYWTNEDLPATADEWLAGAKEQPGSWWNDWNSWLGQYGGTEVKAPKACGNNDYPPIEAAPGRYVKVNVE